MTWTIELLPAAEAEMLESAVWYEERREHLGGEFLAEVQRCFSDLLHEGPCVCAYEVSTPWGVNFFFARVDGGTPGTPRCVDAECSGEVSTPAPSTRLSVIEAERRV